MAVALVLGGCGGAGSDPVTPQAVAQAMLAQARPLAASQVSPVPAAEQAEQLFQKAESSFAGYFPEHQPTQNYSIFAFRHYSNGIYLGVVVQQGSGFSYLGVYVVGSQFGNTLSNPIYAGQLTDYVTPVAPGGGSGVTQAPLVVSAASTSSINGQLDKATPLAAGDTESGSSDATGNYSSVNDYCRVAVYQMTDSGDAKKYALEVVFSKSSHVVSRVAFNEDVFPRTFVVRAAAPIDGVVVDTANRRVGFTNTFVGTAGGASITLNGSLEYNTNAVAADRPACG